MRPVLLFQKQNKKAGLIDRIIGEAIYAFQLIKISMTYSHNKEKRKELAKYIHVLIYFPETDETFDMVGEYKFPFKFGGGARRRQGKMSADLYVPFAEDLSEAQYFEFRDALAADVAQRKPYNYPRLIALAFVFLIPWLFVLIRRMPFSREVFGECCVSWIEVVGQDIGIDFISHGFDTGHAVGELLESNYLSKKHYKTLKEAVDG